MTAQDQWRASEERAAAEHAAAQAARVAKRARASAAEHSHQASALLLSGETLREWVVEVFRQNQPEKLPQVDQILAQYRGKEAVLVRQIQRKYRVGTAKTAKTA